MIIEIDENGYFVNDAPFYNGVDSTHVPRVANDGSVASGMRKPRWTGTWDTHNGQWLNGGWVDDEADLLAAELAEQQVEKDRSDSMLAGADYNGYVVSFTKADGDGMMQVKAAFDMGITNTVIHFENGTRMPITAANFPDFALWFVQQRNKFFV